MISRSSRGFTLIEVILVVLIIGIAATAFVPVALDSLEGARLTKSVRTVVALNKYARAKAVLAKRPTAILYHADNGTVQVVQLPALEESGRIAGFLDNPPPPRLEDDAAPPGTDAVTVLQTRKLGAYVSLEDVERAEKEADTWYALYYANGMCDGHRVFLRDNQNHSARVRIRNLTGDVSVELD